MAAVADAGTMQPEEISGNSMESAGDATYNYDDTGLAGFELDSHILNAHPKARISEEDKLFAQVSRRRQTELERRARIFDAKRRTIGVDKAGLDAQVADRRQMAALQQQMDKKADREMLSFDKQLKVMEIEKTRARKEMEKDCKEYSLQNLNFESRREYDLNDPKANMKSLPARVGDDDPRTGPASMQMFGGEDLMREERIRLQRLAQVNFIEQQKFEKSMMGKHSGEDAAYAAEMREITSLRDEIEAQEVSLRKELQKSQQDANLLKATANQDRRRLEEHLISEANSKELDHHATDPMLNETTPYLNDNGRVRRDAYKGSSRMERVAVRELQEQQMQEKEQRLADEKEMDRRMARQAEQTRRQLVMMEREKQRNMRNRKEQAAVDNTYIRNDQKSGKTQTGTNAVDDYFFNQFGTSTR